MTDNIFSGLKVVDLASFIAGPAAAVILADFGADVIKVEPPNGDTWRIGLVNEVTPAANLIARAEAILAEIFANAPIAVSYALDAVNRGLNGDQAEGLALEAALFGVCAGTADKAEGAAAFLEKRAAAFQGR